MVHALLPRRDVVARRRAAGGARVLYYYSLYLQRLYLLGGARVLSLLLVALLTRLYLLWQAELEYYLDAELTPDEDTDTVELHPSSQAETAEGERGRAHVLQLAAGDATSLLSAESAEELQAAPLRHPITTWGLHPCTGGSDPVR